MRQNTADAIYTLPNIAVPNTAGRPGAYTGSYGQFRLDWTIDRATSFAIEGGFCTLRSAEMHYGMPVAVTRITLAWRSNEDGSAPDAGQSRSAMDRSTPCRHRLHRLALCSCARLSRPRVGAGLTTGAHDGKRRKNN